MPTEHAKESVRPMRVILSCILILTWAIAMGSSLRSGENSPVLDRDSVSIASENTAGANKRVLILYTHRQMSPINAQWHTGLLEAIRRGYREPIDVDVEYMDMVMHADPDYFDQWALLLKRKYSKYPPDVIVPVFFPALTFLLPNRVDFFPGCPIVFCAIPESFGSWASKQPGVTGIGFVLDSKPTVDVIQRLVPGITKLLLLSGSTQMDKWLSQTTVKGIRSCAPGLELVNLDGLSPAEAALELNQAGPNAAALLLTCELDRYGNRYSTAEYLQELNKSTSIPIFGCYDTVLGQGIIGGSLISPVEQGKRAGTLVARVLAGESVDDIPGELDLEHILAFDAEKLHQFGIPESRLPAGSRVINIKPNIWNQYGRYLVVGLAALVAQSAIIVSLLINRKKRVAAEKEARSLAGRILSAGEDERRYLARELHDDVSQRLAAVSIETGMLENRMGQDNEVKDSLGKLKKRLIGICDDLHRMSRHMHPSVLDDFGLPDALKSECCDLAQRWSIPIEFHRTKDFPEIPKSIALCIYRVAQESLWNAIRHSGATKIIAELKSDPEFVYLDIRDDGKGLAPNAAKPNRGLGLASIAERIRLVDGTFKIQSTQGQGVWIAVVVPIPETTDR